MRIDENTTLKQVIQRLGVQDRPWLINPVPQSDLAFIEDLAEREKMLEFMNGRNFSELSLKEILHFCPDWNLPSMIDGLQELVETSAHEKMIYDIWDEKDKEKEPSKRQTGLFAFRVQNAKRFVLICPGGGYVNVCSIAEGFPLAAALKQKGIASFILRYRTAENAVFPNPADDVAQAVKFILGNKETFGLSSDRYGLMGFSAGGHLAATFGTETLGYKKYGVPRPEAMFLGYPVITMGEKTNVGSREELLGDNWDNKEIQTQYSIEKNITGQYPPTFIWNCKEDSCVPCDNSVMLVEALKSNDVKVMYEAYPGNANGWGLGIDTLADGWLDRAVEFLING